MIKSDKKKLKRYIIYVLIVFSIIGVTIFLNTNLSIDSVSGATFGTSNSGENWKWLKDGLISFQITYNGNGIPYLLLDGNPVKIGEWASGGVYSGTIPTTNGNHNVCVYINGDSYYCTFVIVSGSSVTPTPIQTTPAPVYTIVAPIQTTPAPVYTIVAPIQTTPAPVQTTPALVYTVKPTPTITEPTGNWFSSLWASIKAFFGW